MKFSYGLACLLCNVFLAFSSDVIYASATFEVTLLDENNVGFNDSTPATPVGGNSGTTRGEQRQIALNYALNIISQTITGSVPIQLSVQFGDLDSTADFFFLGGAGPTVFLRDFPNAKDPNIWYPPALANQLAGEDLTNKLTEEELTTDFDLDAEFDTGIDDNLNDGVSWYYGLDGLPADDQFDFVTVALHELTHGLGFISTLQYSITNNVATANLYGDYIDIFSTFFQRHLGNPLALLDMNSTQRASALTSTGNLQWRGGAGKFASFGFETGVNAGHLQLYAPAVYEDGSSAGHISDTLTPNDLMEPIYTGAQHDLGLGAAALADIGWGNYTDVVVAAILPIAPVPSNGDYLIQINIVNNGVQDAPNLRLNYTLPSNTTLVSLDTPQGSCDNNMPIASCDLGTLAKRATLSLTATLNSNSITDLTHTFDVSSDIVEANIHNNQTSLISNFSTDSVSITSNAGVDSSALTGQSVTLSGSSNDDAATFNWTQLSGPIVNINNAESGITSFVTPNQSGVLLFQLDATNVQGHTASDTVSIVVNHVPIAQAGADQNIDLNTDITLDGNESADDASITSYSWQQTAGETVTLNNSNSATPSFTSPSSNSNLIFQLTVTDDQGQTATDSVQINSMAPPLKLKSSGAIDIWLILLSVISIQLRRSKK